MKKRNADKVEKPPYPYFCGFDPRGVKLRDVVAHWRSCQHPRCIQMANDWEPLKRQIIENVKKSG